MAVWCPVCIGNSRFSVPGVQLSLCVFPVRPGDDQRLRSLQNWFVSNAYLFVKCRIGIQAQFKARFHGVEYTLVSIDNVAAEQCLRSLASIGSLGQPPFSTIFRLNVPRNGDGESQKKMCEIHDGLDMHFDPYSNPCMHYGQTPFYVPAIRLVDPISHIPH